MKPFRRQDAYGVRSVLAVHMLIDAPKMNNFSIKYLLLQPFVMLPACIIAEGGIIFTQFKKILLFSYGYDKLTL